MGGPTRVACSPSWVTIVALKMLFALPFLIEGVRLVIDGSVAEMTEVALMAALRNLGLGLAAMGPAASLREAFGDRQPVPGDGGLGGRRRGRVGRARPGRGLRDGRDTLVDAGLLEGARPEDGLGGHGSQDTRSRGRFGCSASSAWSWRSRRSDPRGRPSPWRA